MAASTHVGKKTKTRSKVYIPDMLALEAENEEKFNKEMEEISKVFRGLHVFI